MTTTHAVTATPRRPALGRPVAMRLAAVEYDRVVTLLRSLPPNAWDTRTACPDWDVREMAAHLLGMAEMAASIRESTRQTKAATARGGVFIDALTALQVEERADLTPEQIVDRFAVVGPKGMAPADVHRIHEGFVAAFNSPEVRETMAKQGNTITMSTPEQAQTFFRSELVKYAALVKKAGVEPQ